MSLPRIAVDAMGGDEGVQTMVSGAALARRRHDKFKFLLVGDEPRIKAALDAHPSLRGASEILHCDGVVTGDEKPSKANRRAKTTSMGLAVNAVKAGDAGAAVSAGNTGALMAMSKLALRTMPGIDRPALAALLPSLGDNDVIMLDLGANTECDARNLVQFAVMGAAYARTLLELDNPRVALLNIGSEDQKGTDEIRDAAAVLRGQSHLPLNFTGFIEGNQLARGEVDDARPLAAPRVLDQRPAAGQFHIVAVCGNGQDIHGCGHTCNLAVRGTHRKCVPRRAKPGICA